MAEAGLDMNISIFWNLTFTIGAHYSFVLQPMEKIDLTYLISNETHEGTVVSKGTGWKFNAGLKLPFFSK